MKRLFAYFVISLSILACSGDSNNSNLAPSYSNLGGHWIIKEVIKANGTKEAYINLCSAEPDYIKFYYYDKMQFFYHAPTCESGITESCDGFYFTQNGQAIDHCVDFVDGIISTLTATTMEIEYGEVRNFPYPENNLSTAKGLVLQRIQ